ncbi:MAG: hypothetical protein WD646_04715 [Actinomycetota bacterium]
MKSILIVANQTAGGRHLRDEVLRRSKQEPHSFTLLVPATAPSRTMTFTDGEAHALAEERMNQAIESLRGVDVEIDGVVGVSVPMDAIADLLRTRRFDEIIVSTLPHRISHWLRLDLPRRVESRFGLPVTHIVADDDESQTGDGSHNVA